MADAVFTMVRTDEDEDFDGALHSFQIVVNLGDPDVLDGYLNMFSQILNAAGFSYESVGVRSTLSNGEDVEHWSDY